MLIGIADSVQQENLQCLGECFDHLKYAHWINYVTHSLLGVVVLVKGGFFIGFLFCRMLASWFLDPDRLLELSFRRFLVIFICLGMVYGDIPFSCSVFLNMLLGLTLLMHLQ